MSVAYVLIVSLDSGDAVESAVGWLFQFSIDTFYHRTQRSCWFSVADSGILKCFHCWSYISVHVHNLTLILRTVRLYLVH